MRSTTCYIAEMQFQRVVVDGHDVVCLNDTPLILSLDGLENEYYIKQCITIFIFCRNIVGLMFYHAFSDPV